VPTAATFCAVEVTNLALKEVTNMNHKSVTPKLRELRMAIQEAERLSAKPKLMKEDESRINVLLAKIKALQNPAMEATRGGYSPETREFFDRVKQTNGNETRAAMEAGVQSITHTGLSGYVVPIEIFQEVLHGMAQFDPLLDEDLVTLDITEKPFKGSPLQISGWDMSAIAAERVTEASQLLPLAVPAVDGDILNGWSYRVPLAVTFEMEQDGGDRLIAQLQQAFEIGLARGIGEDLVTGTGESQPQGVLTGAANSGVTLDPTIVNDVSNTLNDLFQQAYFSVNRAYRASPKCAWAMSDETYQWIRSITSKSARPLLNIKNDDETLMGKPVVICPSMPSYRSLSIGPGKIVFGDFSHYVVHVSPIWVRRTIQSFASVDKGEAIWTGMMRADAAVFDPTGGITPPLVYINIEP
jgi:HK97 family phage major capsid protein